VNRKYDSKKNKTKKINGKANNGPQKGTCNLYTSSVQHRLQKVGGLVCCFFTATTSTFCYLCV